MKIVACGILKKIIFKKEVFVMSDKVIMKGYKAFDKGLICRGKQYAENTVFEEKTQKFVKAVCTFAKSR